MALPPLVVDQKGSAEKIGQSTRRNGVCETKASLPTKPSCPLCNKPNPLAA